MSEFGKRLAGNLELNRQQTEGGRRLAAYRQRRNNAQENARLYQSYVAGPSPERLRYHEAVIDAMSQPVLQNERRAEGERGLAYLRAINMQEDVIASYMAEFVDPVPRFISPFEFLSQRKEYAGLSPEMIAGAISGVRNQGIDERQRDFKAETLAHQAANDAMMAVAAHMPGGPAAQLEMETQSEFDQRPGGDPVAFGFSSIGRKNIPNEAESQNLQAKRVFSLLQANVGDRQMEGTFGEYQPASATSQGLRAIGARATLFDPSKTLDESLRPADEYDQIARPDGELAYAVDYYEKGRPDPATGRSPNLFDDQERPNYSHLSNYTTEGFATKMSDPRFPIGYGAQSLSPMKHLADGAGLAAGGRGQELSVIRKLRTDGRRGIMPDSVTDKEAYAALVARDSGSEDKASTYWPSVYTKYFGGDKYPSMLAETVMNTPSELYSDPFNLGVNALQFALPGAGAALTVAKQGRKSLIPALRSAAGGIGRNIADDFGEEMIEAAPAGAALGGAAIMAPRDKIAIMGDVRANDPNYAAKQEAANIDRVYEMTQIADDYDRLTGTDRTKKSPVSRDKHANKGVFARRGE